MPRSPDPDLRRLWQARLARYCQSELTIGDFCRREGVSAANFYQWKKKLGGRQAPLPEASPPKFVPLLVSGEAAAAVATLKLPGGVSIELPESLDREQLTELLAACIAATRQASNAETRQ